MDYLIYTKREITSAKGWFTSSLDDSHDVPVQLLHWHRLSIPPIRLQFDRLGQYDHHIDPRMPWKCIRIVSDYQCLRPL